MNNPIILAGCIVLNTILTECIRKLSGAPERALRLKQTLHPKPGPNKLQIFLKKLVKRMRVEPVCARSDCNQALPAPRTSQKKPKP